MLMDKFSLDIVGSSIAVHQNGVAIATASNRCDLLRGGWSLLTKHVNECYTIIDTLPKFADNGEPVTLCCEAQTANGAKVEIAMFSRLGDGPWWPLLNVPVYSAVVRCPVKVGQTLPNGATVVDAKHTKAKRWFVLAVWQRGANVTRPISEYVVWELDPETLACDNGVYRTKVTDAAKIFDAIEG